MDIDDIRGGATISCGKAWLATTTGRSALYKLIMTPPQIHVITIVCFSLLCLYHSV
jgi:hypothetical protein